MANKPVIIFDTSALNKLADEGDSAALTRRATRGFTARLTGTSVDEIAATPEADRRCKLLGLCRRLLSAASCIQPHALLCQALITQFSKTNASEWQAISGRLTEDMIEVAWEEVMNDEAAKKQKDYIRAAQEDFKKVFSEERLAFERVYGGGGAARPAAFPEFLSRLQVEGGPFWSLGMGFYERVTKDRPDEGTVREFVGKCPPFHAFLLANCLAMYERCAKDPNAAPSFRAGKFDLYMSLYLPYCDEFITGDPRQLRALQEVARSGNLAVRVLSYEDFREAQISGPNGSPAP